MRLALVAHGLAPVERTGVETHVRHVAAALGAAGEDVLVFAPRRTGRVANLAERREDAGTHAVHWLELANDPRDAHERVEPPGVAAAFGDFLDRERPDLVHVHHFAKLGFGLVREAKRRGLPVVFTAHDFAAVCHRATRLRPDLTRCERAPCAETCARCDAAAVVLDGIEGLGDWQMGAPPAALDADERERLARALVREADAGLVAARRAADRRRARALEGVDRVLAPSEVVRRRLVEGGLDARRVRDWVCGIPTGALRRLARPDPLAGGPLRFGWFGGVAKHKGLQVLLEAFGALDGSAALEVNGGGTDRPWHDRIRALARRAGARWNGPYDPAELARRMERVDVVCVPSTWDENAPFVVREAFAAGRPVLASDVPGLVASVRDGVDGWLVPMGDVPALRRRMAALDAERAEVARAVEAVRAPRDVVDEAGELRALYAELAASRSAPAPSVPAHLRPFERARARLEALPIDALFGRVVHGVGRLRGAVGLPPTSALAPAVLRANDAARDALRDRARESAWLRSGLEEARRRERELEERAGGRERELLGETARLEGELAKLADHAGWLEGERAALEERLRRLERERVESAERLERVERARGAEAEELRRAAEARSAEAAWLGEQLEAIEAERDWLRDELAARDGELAWRRDTERDRERLQAAYDALLAERTRAASLAAELRTERDSMEGLVAEARGAAEAARAASEELRSELESTEADRAAADRRARESAAELEALGRHEAWLRQAALDLVASAQGARPENGADPEALEHDLLAARERIAALHRDLAWHRREMEAALDAGGPLMRALVRRSEIGRRMRGWRAEGEPT